MLATLVDDLPTDEGWTFEPKYDGIRLVAAVDRHEARLLTRNGIDRTHQLPEIVDALRGIAARAGRSFVVDGELVADAGEGTGRFQALQGSFSRRPTGSASSSAALAFVLFDCLVDGDAVLVDEPWRVRRRHLSWLVTEGKPLPATLRLAESRGDGSAMLERAREGRWEGIIAKRIDAPYEPGQRSRAWRKFKLGASQELVIGGWTEPRQSRQHLGALLLGYYDDDGVFVYAGHTGAGMSRDDLAQLGARLRRLERPTSPFSRRPRTNAPAHWVQPSVVVEVKFTEWTDDGRLRHPVFVGVREDKRAREIRRERPADVVPDGRAATVRVRERRLVAESATVTAKSSARTRELLRVLTQLDEIEGARVAGTLELSGGTLVEVSNLHKVFYPAHAWTKGDLMRYYVAIAPNILPALADRPLVLKRYPNGVGGKAFYQQHARGATPAGVRVEAVPSTAGAAEPRFVGGDLATLLHLVQLGAISMDPWHARHSSLATPDYTIIDLDPGPGAGFPRVIEVALAVKRMLDEYGLVAVPKTSGASGMHIVLPLARGTTEESARLLAELVATRVAQTLPKLATIERGVSSRPARTVYVDFMQNIRGKTVAAAYSARAERDGTVSMPLRWAEVAPGLDPRDFTIATAPRRVRAIGDLWADGLRVPNSLGGIGVA